VKVTQRLQLRSVWRYLLLVVDPRAGTLRWAWLERMRQTHLEPVLRRWALEGLVWDGAGSHRGKLLAPLPTPRVLLPPYAPELNPAERVFEELRRQVEGRVYPSIEDKQAAAETSLAALSAEPTRVRRLCGWQWLTADLDALPPAA
jgi:transposase